MYSLKKHSCVVYCEIIIVIFFSLNQCVYNCDLGKH